MEKRETTPVQRLLIRPSGAALLFVLMGAPLPRALSAAPDDALQARLRDCAQVRVDSERLACFDRTVKALDTGEMHSAASATPEAVFGLTRADRAPASRHEGRELDQISARLSKIDTTADETLLLTLDNGQVWRTTEASRSVSPKPGDTVTIARAALGSFRLSMPGGRVVRVKRIR